MKFKLLTVAVAILSANSANAAIMTFTNLPGEYASPFTTYTENGFTLTRTSGYSTKASTGTPAPAVVNYGYNVGYDFTAAGSLFTFQGFGLRVPFGDSASYSVVGLLGGNQIFTYSGQLGPTNDAYPLQQNPSGSSVDLVRLVFNNYGRVQGSSTMDDISSALVTGAPSGGSNGAVPEPATWAMMMFGFGSMGFAMRHKAKVSTRIRFA